ncbi:MAG: hypothetical protein IKV90_05050 [Clostridia bacterium]|nr:hypothetical protein [Clostridia bacterium]
MSQNENKAKKTKTKQKKPIRLARNWGSAVVPSAGRIVPMLILLIIMGFMFTGIQAIEAYMIRLVLAGVLGAVILLLMYSEGLNCGVADISVSRTCAQAIKDGRKLEEKEESRGYHPVKALATVALVFGVPFVLAVIVALNAKEYTYVIQSLPTWLTGSYGARADVMAPLAAYNNPQGMAALDWMRMIVRLFELPLVNLFEDPQKMTAMVDRFSPLMIAIMPIAYMIGYLASPSRAEKIAKLNRRAKKVAVRRAERRKVGPELIGAQNQVHYGHKKEEKARKKKELI